MDITIPMQKPAEIRKSILMVVIKPGGNTKLGVFSSI